jgi:hypothetical protein
MFFIASSIGGMIGFNFWTLLSKRDKVVYLFNSKHTSSRKPMKEYFGICVPWH